MVSRAQIYRQLSVGLVLVVAATIWLGIIIWTNNGAYSLGTYLQIGGTSLMILFGVAWIITIVVFQRRAMKREAAQKRDLATLKKATSVHELETMTKKQGVVVVDGLSDIGMPSTRPSRKNLQLDLNGSSSQEEPTSTENQKAVTAIELTEVVVH
jgi:uncharacterized membrane protein